MLEEDRRVVAAHAPQRSSPTASSRVRRHRHAPADAVHPRDLIGLAVPRIAALEESAGNAHHDGRGEAIVGAPAQRAAVIELLGGRLRVLAELDLGDGHEARERHADGAADDALLREAGIEHARRAVLVLQAERRAVHAALGPDVLAKHEQARIARELDIERAADRRQHVDARRLRRGLRRGGRETRGPRGRARPGAAARAPLRIGSQKHVALQRIGRGCRACERAAPPRLRPPAARPRSMRCHSALAQVRRHGKLMQRIERIARTLAREQRRRTCRSACPVRSGPHSRGTVSRSNTGPSRSRTHDAHGARGESAGSAGLGAIAAQDGRDSRRARDWRRYCRRASAAREGTEMP